MQRRQHMKHPMSQVSGEWGRKITTVGNATRGIREVMSLVINLGSEGRHDTTDVTGNRMSSPRWCLAGLNRTQRHILQKLRHAKIAEK
jgi:hypothetical protein